MTKAIEHAQWCQNHSNGMYGDQVTAMKDEFLRLAAVEQELADLKAAMGELVAITPVSQAMQMYAKHPTYRGTRALGWLCIPVSDD